MQAIRNFAKSLEAALAAGGGGAPAAAARAQAAAASALAAALRRYTSLNHLAQAARAVLNNHLQIHQVMTSLVWKAFPPPQPPRRRMRPSICNPVVPDIQEWAKDRALLNTAGYAALETAITFHVGDTLLPQISPNDLTEIERH